MYWRRQTCYNIFYLILLKIQNIYIHKYLRRCALLPQNYATSLQHYHPTFAALGNDSSNWQYEELSLIVIEQTVVIQEIYPEQAESVC